MAPVQQLGLQLQQHLRARPGRATCSAPPTSDTTIRVVVTATNAGGSASATSNQTAVVQAPSPPGNTALPTIAGTAKQGQTLTASNGSWSNNPTSFAYQWRRCSSSGSSCINISGATGQSYVLVSADVGQRLIRVVVTATNPAGSASATSNQTAVVQAQSPPGNTALPTIAGTANAGADPDRLERQLEQQPD